MIISTTTGKLSKRFTLADAIKILADAGFDAYDYSIHYCEENDPLYSDSWKEYLAKIRAGADALGILCNQAHAPFPSRHNDTPQHAEYNATIFDRLVRSIEGSALLGAKAIVIHPIQCLPYAENVGYLRDSNLELYRALAPYAKKSGIKIALENMFQRKDGVIVDSVCSQPEEFIDYLDTLADDCFTACLDLGHCVLTQHNTADMIRALGSERLTALHVHDNDNKTDLHTLPYHGKMDWEEITDALAEIGYRGDFTLEADTFMARVPNELLTPIFTTMKATARYLADKVTAKAAKAVQTQE